MLALGNPELREIGVTELCPEDIRSAFFVRIQDDQVLPFLVIWDGSNDTGSTAEELADHFLYLAVWHHLASNFAETRQAVGEMDEAICVDHGDITRDIPAVPQHVCR